MKFVLILNIKKNDTSDKIYTQIKNHFGIFVRKVWKRYLYQNVIFHVSELLWSPIFRLYFYDIVFACCVSFISFCFPISSENRRSDLSVSPVKVWYSNKVRYSNKMLLIFCSLRFIFTYSARYFCCWTHMPEQRNCLLREVRMAFAITIKYIYQRKRWHCKHAAEECPISWKASRDITGRTWFIS